MPDVPTAVVPQKPLRTPNGRVLVGTEGGCWGRHLNRKDTSAVALGTAAPESKPCGAKRLVDLLVALHPPAAPMPALMRRAARRPANDCAHAASCASTSRFTMSALRPSLPRLASLHILRSCATLFFVSSFLSTAALFFGDVFCFFAGGASSLSSSCAVFCLWTCFAARLACAASACAAWQRSGWVGGCGGRAGGRAIVGERAGGHAYGRTRGRAARAARAGARVRGGCAVRRPRLA